jgi:spermidine synthase
LLCVDEVRSQSRLLRVAPLVFGSGLCALVYQTTWLREFRLIFGASTAATAAVLGIFMGGIGVGSAILGRRSESKARPLQFYAKLELMIGASAAATPVFLWIIRHAYLAMGGTLTMGIVIGTIVRLLLSALAIGLPTFLMGGTLPALARVVTMTEDANRRSVALLYGINTLGAVAGAVAATFYLFEAWGNRVTLGAAASVNILVGFAAFWISKNLPTAEEQRRSPDRTQLDQGTVTPVPFVLVASAAAGFVFLLMELVWYRMLAPLLGGSTFTFGLILAVALFGIGLGGLIYAFGFSNRRVTLAGFAFVCALEGLFIAAPYALGDRIALTAMLLRPLGSLGLYGHVMAWTAICTVVVLPAAVISGIQFPTLIALLGKGKTHVGADTGRTYAWNTGGAILGSFCGGFGLLPALSAPGAWRFVVVILCALAAAAVATSIARTGNYFRQLPALGTAAFALCLLTATGPTSFWRHGQIGVGRLAEFTGSKSDYHDLENAVRRNILWDTDGVESSVALSHLHGLNFLLNGRSDGHAQGDKGTQIMMGLIPAVLQEKPARALVIGLGTGSSAGWLAAIPAMERVDVVELEPAILKVAQACAPVNHQALSNPKVHVIIGDGREVLLSTREKYDVIASEPSNPYRAGIASLFTREFYEAAASRLSPGGLFAQWVQAYEIDPAIMETVYATIGSVFPQVDTWQTQEGDLLLVASTRPRAYDAEILRSRIEQEPFKSALLNAWGATNLEGFLARFVANNSLVQAMAHVDKVRFNTDDHTVLEFAYARNMDPGNSFRTERLRSSAKAGHADHLDLSNGEDKVRWDEVEDARLSMLLDFGEIPNPEEFAADSRSRAAAYASFVRGDFPDALELWRERPREAKDINDLRLVAECMADEGNTETEPYIDKLREFVPTEADAILAHLLYRRGQYEQATEVLENVFHRLRTDPWPNRELTARTLLVARRVVEQANSALIAQRLHQALRMPFCVFNSEEPRRICLLEIGTRLDKGNYGEYTLAAVEPAEPYIPWQAGFLKLRKACYQNVGSPRLAQAERDLNQFMSEQPRGLQNLAFSKQTAPWEQSKVGYGLERRLDKRSSDH